MATSEFLSRTFFFSEFTLERILSLGMSKTFTGAEIHDMNCKYPWNGTIQNREHSSTLDIRDSKTRYTLHATGYADTNGRRYVYLPSDMKITAEVKMQHNLM